MKRILAGVLALVLLGYFGCSANAAEIVAQGSEKIAVMGGANYADVAGDVDAYAAMFVVAGEYGYMVCDQFEMAARAMFALAQVGTGGTDVRMQAYSIVFVPKWRIPMEGNISPYVGPKAGAAYITGSSSGKVKGNIGGIAISSHYNDSVFIWGLVAGADIFLSKQTSIFVEYDYTQFKLGGSDLGGGPVRVRDNGISAGLAYWW